MTTVVVRQEPLQLRMSEKPRRSKRQTATDYEQDDDFQFVRKSKKPKTQPGEDAQAEAVAADPIVASLPVRRQRARAAKKVEQPEEDAPPPPPPPPTMTTTTTTSTTTTKRPAKRRQNVEGEEEDQVVREVKAKRRTRRTAREEADELDMAPEEPAPAPAPAPEPEPEPELGPKPEPPKPKSKPKPRAKTNGRGKAKAAPKAAPIPIPTREESPIHEESVESAKIALPMSDTPIINRNKEMRKKGGTANRRSSLGSRGRRASSLIDSGQAAIPHREVDAAEFYKHIEAEGLPEPRRMKQLLMWCGERALAAKPQHGNPNSSAILGARAIQDQLLKDFAAKSECSDWFSREEEAPRVPVVLQPNPRNIELDEKRKALEAKINKLQEEKKSWLAIRKPPPEEPPLFGPDEADRILLPDFSLLDPDDTKIRGFLADEANSLAALRSRTEARLRRIQGSLEFEVDQLADSVHKLEQRVGVAGREADAVLALSSRRLREREERHKQRAGTGEMPIMEVLRSLSSILPEGGG